MIYISVFIFVIFGKDPGLFSPVILMSRINSTNYQTAKNVMLRLLLWQNSIFWTSQLNKVWYFMISTLIFSYYFITMNILYFICVISFFTINPLKYTLNISVFLAGWGMFILIMVGRRATFKKRVISRPKSESVKMLYYWMT